MPINTAYCRRLEERGLISKPEIKRLGRGKGVEAYYPDNTCQRIMKIIMLRCRGFSYDKIPLALWNAGDEINIRPLFKESMEEYKTFMVRVQAPNQSNSSSSIFDNIGLPKQLSLIRKWVGSKHMPTLNYLLLLAVNEDSVLLSKEDLEYDQDTFDSAYNPILRNITKLPPIYELLSDVRPYLDPDNWEELLSDSNDEALLQAYHEINEIYAILNYIMRIARVLQGKRPKKQPFETFQKLDVHIQCIFTLGWLSFRQEEKLLEGFHQIRSFTEPLFKDGTIKL